MKHIGRIIVIAAGACGVAYSSALASPAVQNLIARHPAVAAYVFAAVGVVGAVYAYLIEQHAAGAAAQPPKP